MQWRRLPPAPPEIKLEWVVCHFRDIAAAVGEVIQPDPNSEVFDSFLFPAGHRHAGKGNGTSELGRFHSLVAAKAAVEAAYAKTLKPGS